MTGVAVLLCETPSMDGTGLDWLLSLFVLSPSLSLSLPLSPSLLPLPLPLPLPLSPSPFRPHALSPSFLLSFSRSLPLSLSRSRSLSPSCPLALFPPFSLSLSPSLPLPLPLPPCNHGFADVQPWSCGVGFAPHVPCTACRTKVRGQGELYLRRIAITNHVR